MECDFSFASGNVVIGEPVCRKAKIPSLFKLCLGKIRDIGVRFDQMSLENMYIYLGHKIPEIVINDIYKNRYNFHTLKDEEVYLKEKDSYVTGRLKITKEKVIDDCIIKRSIKKKKTRMYCQILIYDSEWEIYAGCPNYKKLVYLSGHDKVVCEDCINEFIL